MGKRVVDDASLTAVADTIRDRMGGSSDPLVFPEGFVDGVAEVYKEGYYIGEMDGYETGHKSGIEDGAQAEYDRFWDANQQNGNRTNYAYGYCGLSYTDENFRPKYDFVLSGKSWESGYYMFYNSPITDIAKALQEAGCGFDTSGATGMSWTFGSCKTTTVPALDLSSATTISNCFNTGKMSKIELRNIQPNCTLDNTFANCAALVDLVLSGEIGNAVNLQWSTKLSRASIENIMGCLSTTTSGLSITLSKTAVNAAFTDAEWAALVATRNNWTINLV